jgi:hypothetical protein
MEAMIRWRALLTVGVAAWLAGCSVYDTRYAYKPMTATVEAPVPGAGGTGPPVTLVQIVGVRRADERSQLPASVQVRLKVQNASATAVAFDPASLVLAGAGIDRFPDPVLRPAEVTALAPAESAEFEAYFPLPGGREPGDLDLSALRVRWQLDVGARAVDSIAAFELLPTAYYDRYPNRTGGGFQRYDTH